MRWLWSFALNIGVTPDIPDRDAKYIRITNGFAIFVALWMFSAAVFFAPYLPSSKYLVIDLLSFAVLLLLSLYLNSRKAYLAAKLNLGFGCLVCNSVAALQMGRDSENHWLLINLALGAFYLWPPRQFKYVALLSISSLLSIVALELYLTDREPILEAPPEFFLAARLLSITFLCILTFVITLMNYRALNAAQDLAEREHQKSESLLLNILPESIVQRLKKDRSVIADRIPSATILFADVVNFTKLSQTMPAEQLVRLLNDLFVEFDHLSTKYGLEKIKTIGDAYMVVGGLPAPLPDHCTKVAFFALEIQDLLKHRSYTDAKGLQVRVGMHTGPVVAGVIGENKFLYDLWGDTVNTASRMESHGDPGKIQVTSEVREVLKHTFGFSPARSIDVKGKGWMKVYFLTGSLGVQSI